MRIAVRPTRVKVPLDTPSRSMVWKRERLRKLLLQVT